MIRLSTAHAKCRLSSEVTDIDAQVALDMMNFALFNEANPRTGTVPTAAPALAAAVSDYHPDDDNDDEDEDQGGDGNLGSSAGAQGRRRSDEVDHPDQAPRKRARDQEDEKQLHEAERDESTEMDQSADSSQMSQELQLLRTSLIDDTERVELFERLTLDALKATEECRMDELFAAVNKGSHRPFTKQEMDVLLDHL
eukprot:CAMPEP_0177668144 /NCGR_PEP_ID=MMETSP0447-20121125/22572_1 /TAXON_ID=0 /ORGANISM="Stygamoeba regulata, Strain BSH-02190019" /LENGTH=196 /DNA_ID=CAMNT_0019174567 /DNA_START=33 /DNA_END=620 /DNA_ORIENTATION=+